MGITKHKMQDGTQERLTMFGPTWWYMQGDDAELYVDVVDVSALAVGAELTVKQQPLMPHSLSFSAPIGKDFTALLRVSGEDGWGRLVSEDVTVTSTAAQDGSSGDPWTCVQTRIPFKWLDSIRVVEYEEASATGAGNIAVGLIQSEDIGGVYYDNEGIAIQVQRGLTNLELYITTENVATGVLNTEPRLQMTVDAENGRCTLGFLLAGPERLLGVSARPDLTGGY